jgi:hypothetical protein
MPIKWPREEDFVRLAALAFAAKFSILDAIDIFGE